MESLLNDLIREFYLGENSAWEKITDLLSNKMKNRFSYKFGNLCEPDRENCVPAWEVNFFAKVVFARQEADKYIRTFSNPLSQKDIERIKIEFCSAKTSFNPTLAVPFEAWMWISIRSRGIDLTRKNKPLTEIVDETEMDTLLSAIPPNPTLTRFQRGDNDEDVRKIKELLKPGLDANELIYLELWFEKFGEPTTPEVKNEIKKATDKTVSDAAVSNLKQGFLMKCYLKLLDHLTVANALASLFQRLMTFSKIDEKMFLLMMDNIWTDFYQNQAAAEKYKTEICPVSWKKWEASTQKRESQKQILVKAYQYFRWLNPRPFFCFKIELYADNRFGGKIKELFLEGSTDE